MKALIACLCTLIFFIGQLGAQQNTANLSGTVTDTSNATVAGATVRLESVGTGVVRSVISAADGRFSFQFLPVGTYSLTVSQTGFHDVVRSGLQLATGQDLNLPIQLELQQVRETVQVMAEAAALDTTSVEQRTTLTLSQVNQLPVQHLDWTNLLQLSSGTVKPIQPSLTASAAVSHSTGGSGLNVNGLPANGYSLTIDGTNASENVEFNAFNAYQNSGLISAVNNDAIAEVSVGKGIPPATVGNAMSGSINIVTKSGTNDYHGSLYEVNEVSAYDARNQFLTNKPRTTFNEYGGSFGAPILKNQVFFFGSWEGAQLSTSTLVTGPSPTPYLISIAPPVYQSLLHLFPATPQPANNPTATTGQFIGAAPTIKQDNNGVDRVDYYVNQKNLIAMRYIRTRPYELIPNLIPTDPRYYDGHVNAANVTYTHFGTHWTENTRVAYNHLNLNRYDLGWATGLPTMSFGFSTGGPGVFRSRGAYTTFQEGVAFFCGKHTIQFGGIVERNDPSRLQFSTYGVSYATLAQFLANTPSSTSISVHDLAPGVPAWGVNFYQYGVYVQDDWRATNSLTFNIGLRYDLFTVPQAFNGQIYNRDVDPNNPGLGPGFGPFRPFDSFVDGNHLNFQPRVGLAYNVGGKGSTVIRAGLGTFVANRPVISGEITAFRVSPTLPIGVGLNQALTAAAGLNYPIDQSLYAQQVAQLQAQGVLSKDLASQLNPANGSNPTSIQWTFGIQQSLPWRSVLEVNYNGNRGLHEVLTMSYNLPDRLTGIAPRQGFGSFGGYDFSDLSKYSSLQTEIRKMLSNGLQFSTGFTWSKVNSFGPADVLYGPVPQDPYNVRLDWGPAPFDVRRRFVLNGLWDLPITKWTGISSKFAEHILGGWQISGVFTAQSGFPVNITNSQSTWPQDRPDAAGLPQNQVYLSGYQTGLHQYLSPAAFIPVAKSSASNAQVRDGNLGRNAIFAPGLENLDFTLSKSFFITERVRFQLRADSFNTLNHTNLTGMVTTINTPGTFGELTQATARTMQLGGRISF